MESGFSEQISPQRRRPKPYVGTGLMLVSALHIVFGIAATTPLLLDAVHEGWAGAFTGERATVMWFLMTGCVGLIAGLAIGYVERAGPLPWRLSIGLLVVALIGVSMAPTSGFVLVLAVAILAVGRSFYTKRAAEPEEIGEGR